MRGINMKMALLPILLMSMLAGIVAIKPANAQAATISLSPTHNTGNVGDYFNVDVMIADIVDLYGYEFKVLFDPNIVAAVAITVGDFFPSPPGYQVWMKDVGEGYAWLAVTRPLGSPSGVSGSGRLATIQFLVVGDGFTYLIPSDLQMGDVFGGSIVVAVEVASFANVTPVYGVADIRKRRSTNRPGEYIFKISVHGYIQTLYGEIENLGNGPVAARVRFEVFDEAGLPPYGGSIMYSPTVVLQPGEARVLTVGMLITWEMAGYRWYVSNYCEYDGDGGGALEGAGDPAKVRSYSFRIET